LASLPVLAQAVAVTLYASLNHLVGATAKADPHRTPSSIALEHLIVAGATAACGCGTVGIERWGGARSDGLSLWAAARDFLFLDHSRCCSGGAQNNGSGQRKYRPYRHFGLLVATVAERGSLTVPEDHPIKLSPHHKVTQSKGL
jgi:hypothetical protein